MTANKSISIFLIASLLPLSHLYAKQITIDNNGDWVSELKKLKPGDTAIFTKGRFGAGSYAYRNKIITINGTQKSAITIKGAGTQDTILDGEGSGEVLFFKNCSNLIIENFTITNPSRFADGRNKRIAVKSGNLSEGIILGGGDNITIRKSLFDNIGTRGVFTSYSDGHLNNFTLERNLFFNVGNDTASGDINMNSGKNWTIKHNLFAGNVDGIVLGGKTLGGGLIEQNILMNHWQEDNIDIKGHRGNAQTTIRNNILYSNRTAQSGLTVQNSSRNVTIDNNIFYHGAPVAQIWIHGRNHDDGSTDDPVTNISITNNVLYGDNAKSDNGILINKAEDKGAAHRPVPITKVNVENNYILNQKNTVSNAVGENTKLSNNKFTLPSTSREQEFKKLEKSILEIMESTFSSTIIQKAFKEAQVPYTSAESPANLKLSPPTSRPSNPHPAIL